MRQILDRVPDRGPEHRPVVRIHRIVVRRIDELQRDRRVADVLIGEIFGPLVAVIAAERDIEALRRAAR